MLSLEICQKLKEAGFPQHCTEVMCIHHTPTLEELIEECGTDFNTLYRSDDVFIATQDVATGYDWELWQNRTCAGSTPEEAVANLYLKLHQKEDGTT